MAGAPNKGRITAEEKMYIIRMTGKMTKNEIATALGRCPSSIKKIQRKNRITQELKWAVLPPYDEKAMNRIWARLEIKGECWITKKNEVMVKGIFYTLSRLLYFWHNHIDLEGLELVRECGQLLCVNPSHYRCVRRTQSSKIV